MKRESKMSYYSAYEKMDPSWTVPFFRSCSTTLAIFHCVRALKTQTTPHILWRLSKSPIHPLEPEERDAQIVSFHIGQATYPGKSLNIYAMAEGIISAESNVRKDVASMKFVDEVELARHNQVRGH